MIKDNKDPSSQRAHHSRSTGSSSTGTKIDYMAIGLSGLCVLHCVAMPLLAISLPIFAVIAEAEWLHKLFVLLSFPISGLAIIQIRRHLIDGVFVSLALIGLSLLFASAYLEQFHLYEERLTILGAFSLASAHFWRLCHHYRQQ